MTKLLDRVLGMAASKKDGSAGCPPDPYTETLIKCYGSTYIETCYRTCQTTPTCGHTCGSWGSCRCVASHAAYC